MLGGVLATLVLLAAGTLASRLFSPRRSELLRLYETNARQVFRLSRVQAHRVFADRALQRQLLNPSVGLEQEWGLLRSDLSSHVPEELLADPEPFYRELVTDLELSEHWRERARTLTEQLARLGGT